MNKFLKYICAFAWIIIGSIFCYQDIYAADAPYVTKAKLISGYDIELYWSEEVEGAGNINHFSVTVDGKECPIYAYTWEEYGYSETGVVYYNPRSSEYPNNPDTPKTSIRLWDAITDTADLPEIEITVAGNKIKNIAGEYALEQTIAVTEYDAFYQQEIVMDCGVKILGTKNVRPEAMTKAEEMLEIILANEAIAKRMGEAGCMLGIFGEGEIAYDILEHRYTYDENYLYVEGFGGTPLASIKDANVLRLREEDYWTNYADESILVHEFGHTVQNYGLTDAQYREWENIYNESVTKGGKWPNSYAGSNSSEYFATLSAIWFNAMDDTWDGEWDGVRGPVNTRSELKAYDKAAYDFLSEIYVSDKYLPSPWENGSVPDNTTWSDGEAGENNGGSNSDENDNSGSGNIGSGNGNTESGSGSTESGSGSTESGNGNAGSGNTESGNGNAENGNSSTEGGNSGANSGIVKPQAQYCTVTFVYNNGMEATTAQVFLGSKVTQPEQPVKKGYLWQGWYAGNEEFSFDNYVTGDIILEAKWKKVKVGKSAVSSLKAAKGRKVTLKVKKVSDADGYKITYCANAKFKKGVKTKYITKNKLTLKKMKKGTWYFKVQAYRIDSTGKKVFGKISKAKKIKVRK